MLAKLLVLTAALAITLTPGCKRKAQGPITPLPSARVGIDNPRPGGPTTPGGVDRPGRLGDGGGARATDLGPDGGATGTTPQENLTLAQGPLDRSQYNEDRAHFAANVVLFEFDSAVVRTGEKSKITAVSDYLKSNASAAIEVEGHCDERGTEEYNRSLGEKRALGVREELALGGIDPRRIHTISYGEDRPAVNGHDADAWARNRRAEFILLTPR